MSVLRQKEYCKMFLKHMLKMLKIVKGEELKAMYDILHRADEELTDYIITELEKRGG